MPFGYRRHYKRYKPSSRRYKRKKYSKRGNMRARRGRNVYYFTRMSSKVVDYAASQSISTIQSDGVGVDSVFNLAVRLSDIPNYTEFTNLYDEYRIRAVKFNFIPIANVSSYTGTTGSTGTSPTYSVRSYSVVDNIIDSAPAFTIDDMRQYQRVKWRPYNRIHSRYAKVYLNINPGGAGALWRTNDWISTDTGSVGSLYAGIIFGVEKNNAPAGTILYQIEAKYYMQFRTVK